MTSASDARSPRPSLIVYSRQGCHLCELMIEALLPMLRGRADLEIRDIDTRDDWREQYGERVPVLTLNGRTVCQYHLDTQALERMLDSRGPGIGAQPGA
ncbi:MAG: glutaredoxin family protein [Woeseia sp.]